jgi:hypothetical protein
MDGGGAMSGKPSEALGNMVYESGSIGDEVLLAVADELHETRAVLDDPIHGELKRIADALENIDRSLAGGSRLSIATLLQVIANRARA